MTAEQYQRLVELSIGLLGTLDAADTLCTDREAADSLHAAALAMSRTLRELVELIEPEAGNNLE